MMRHTLYMAILVLISVLRVQSQNYVWAQRIGNTKSDKVVCVKSDAFGNIYISNYFRISLYFGITINEPCDMANAIKILLKAG